MFLGKPAEQAGKVQGRRQRPRPGDPGGSRGRPLGGGEPGPTIAIHSDEVWSRATTSAEFDEILERHFGRGERVEHLMLRPENDPAPAK